MIENALIGPLVAVFSFVYTVGNVPMAAALFNGGISFGGVLAFIYGDPIVTRCSWSIASTTVRSSPPGSA